jgi:glucosamine-6-phosphate deaminase
MNHKKKSGIQMNYAIHTYGKATVRICNTRNDAGGAAAEYAAGCIRKILSVQETANIVFAAAPSQNEFLAALVATPNVDWQRINAFHMDEYIGLPPGSDQFFSLYLQRHLFSHVHMKNVFLLDSQASDPARECERYAALLQQCPTDLVCMGIGENGHIAFNDPPVADFNDKALVKVVELDEPDRHQQVHDGCFPSFEDVPTHAYTLTVPALMCATFLSVVVPSERKAVAVKNSLTGPIGTAVPGSILRTHAHVEMFLDPASASLLM